MKEKYVYECEKCGYVLDENKPNQPSFEDIESCPKCGADKSSLKRIPEKETKKAKLERKLKELKEKEKEQLKKDKELKEAELKKSEEVLDFIYDKTILILDDLIYSLTKKKEITPERFADIFFEESFNILYSRKSEYYPSNYFVRNFRDIIKDFTDNVIDSFNENELYATRKIDSSDEHIIKIEDKETERIKRIIDNSQEKVNDNIKERFTKLLRNEVK